MYSISANFSSYSAFRFSPNAFLSVYSLFSNLTFWETTSPDQGVLH